MTGQQDASSRQNRRLVVLGHVVLIVGFLVGALSGAAVLQADTAAANVQDDSAGNETGTDPDSAGANATDDGRDDGNESGQFPPIDGEVGLPHEGSATAGPAIVQAPADDIEVAVAEGQSVRAGGATTVTLEVTNDGDDDAMDVVVTLQAPDGTLSLGAPNAPQAEQSVSLGDLEEDETETVDVRVAAAAVEPGTYPVFATVQYLVEDGDEGDDGGNGDDNGDNGDDEAVVIGGPSVLAIDLEERPRLGVTPVDGTVPVDGDGVYEVRISNDGTEPVSGVVATLEAGPPLSSESPTAYVGTLHPGESETVRFALESSSDAIETTTSATITLTYETGHDGDGQTATNPISVPVSLVESDGEADVESIAPFVVVAFVFALALLWWYRRR
ncbi:COG1361 S-layer family protein [Natronosalvus rutilus]|uniref:DUF11 domain-containing protein n=1 Tax=Natronosalvus rutilus TaxID=2953753 RepID=A0A9E7N7E3_9EURY|nr:hypothetical protein [Natronosalvus rutilus]UTF52201.1 hypothetical protein NGM29_10355 [Natronosalvus rutilus]